MTVDTMRAIDRYLGIPLCFIATIICKIFFRPKKDVKPQKVLFIELSEMGSAILADPAMRKIRQKYDAELHFLIFKKNKASLELLQTVPDENIFAIDPQGIKLIKDTLLFLQWARRKKIDTVIDIELFSRYTALLTGFSGADNRIGFYRYHNEGLYRGEMLTHRIAYNHYKHISENFIAMINALDENSGGDLYSKSLVEKRDIILFKARITEEEKEKMRKTVDEAAGEIWRVDTPRILLVNSNASDLLPQRRWPADHFVLFIQMMLARYTDVLALLTGAKAEFLQAENIRTNVNNPRCINFTGKATLKELLSLYSISCTMLTNDSGPGHFSAVTDLPTVVIFGPETPALYGSLGNSIPLFLGLSCSPCVNASNHRKTSCTDNVCVKKITPESVAVVISEILDKI
ncbi:MAG: hypothetical protein LBH05_07065 [Deferribacteraceae bacterium]|jgi:ADP-heptose:LPS heptosyltransferase|nr:hypothetical protein [Deferribacteraceae bacterium]